MQHTLVSRVKQFGQTKQHALVIGDVMLDRYLIGEVSRISPEAPVPVVLLKKQNERAGGASNVAANLALLGVQTHILGCIGQDTEGKSLMQLMQASGIDTQGMVTSSHRPTIAKTRVLGGHQQMMRLDQENSGVFNAEETSQILNAFQQALAKTPSIVVLSDYAKGLLSTTICQTIIQACQQANIPILVDPKGVDYSKYQGATALTPNKKETAEACHTNVNDVALIEKAQQLKSSLGLQFLAVTRSEEGITLLDDTTHHLQAAAQQVFDVSGAGDTVIATLAAGLMHGLSPLDSLELANVAAGVVVGKVGTVPITKSDLIHALEDQRSNEQAHKICDLPELLEKVAVWKQAKQAIVFTNGCFDLLHAGHVTYLEAAKKRGDKLILGLNTDRSVSALKGPTRPVVNENDRARVLAALASVDAVILFDEDTPLNLIHAIQPNIIAKGSDYTADQVVGGKEVLSWGGEIALIDLVEGRSTSNLIKKMNS
ncbi:bifunctional D-glycero-beta-D-manno-heptose-7-phosphate kinase/D-glycero-beta-D-manno-heptose 1-phosphate adenylyltransferase HldE [Methylotenera sp. N17]|uniref:bifunctional D-glycero-beta-D-manno-heptose-7-phosphate kinase/D-glycero-beta-D-manno-heptose 1-phosphate adenylyltransferase HldE n=1 Tax=Methylotenera sp. N17 TaxID=1502761 RepID=UPI000647C5CD|nr:bifunctional D-glycero-beta-D-manno-heptose-7-phosphate kinase/D-glycero-beta-D-manno-heptose 1-phosphate adenylyltransferase HldE [Methylotenera sp. N17]